MDFHAKMIAPCGLNCSVCIGALREENPCLGCWGPDEAKPEFCASQCKIASCTLRRTLPGGFCDECPQYPCAEMTERETRYMNDYPLSESPMGNLASIRKVGMNAFLNQERTKWSCISCGGTICVHTGHCAACGTDCTPRKSRSEHL